MSRLTESAIEDFAVKLVERLGCIYALVGGSMLTTLGSGEVRIEI